MPNNYDDNYENDQVTPGGEEISGQENTYPDISEMEDMQNRSINYDDMPETPGNDEVSEEAVPPELDYPDLSEIERVQGRNSIYENDAETPGGLDSSEPVVQERRPLSEQFVDFVEEPVNNAPQENAPQENRPKIEDEFEMYQEEENEPQANAPQENRPNIGDQFEMYQEEENEPQANAPQENKPSILDQFEDIVIEVPQNGDQKEIEDVQFNIPANMSHLKPLFGDFKAEDFLGKAPDLSGQSQDTAYTSEQGSVMLDVIPATALEQQAKRLKNIQLAYAKEVSSKGFDLRREQQAKTDILLQIAEMKKLTSQSLMVAGDDELFSMGDKNGMNIFVGGKEKILADGSTARAMDAKLDMVDAAIRKGWPMSDLDALGNMAALAESIDGLREKKYVAGRDKEKIEEFVNFIEEIKKVDFRNLREDERYEKIEEAESLLDKLPVEAREDEFEDLYRAAKDSLKAAYKSEPKKIEIGHTQAGWDKIKMKSFTENDLETLKKNTKEKLEAASSTLQAKCMSEKGANEKPLSKSDAIKAYAAMFEKNSSMLHKDSPQFKQIKDGIKKVTGAKVNEADRQKLLEDVKNWLTDPKYDRAKKHGASSFDNKRFNDVFALANELDPKWAKENFNRMNLCAHHGDKSSQFKNINDFLNAEHKLIIDNKCIENSAAQKNKSWYKGGKVKNVKLSDLENQAGMGKNQGSMGKRPNQKNAVKKGPSKVL